MSAPCSNSIRGYSGAHQICFSRFFGELSRQLNLRDDDRTKEVARALTDLGLALAPLVPMPGTQAAFKLLLASIGKRLRPQSLVEERDRLRTSLQQSGTKIVVVVDDIDRLEPAETREVMRLVRLTSDMPNLVFLLAFDRQRVANSLGEQGGGGQNYLEKIVQINHTIPAVREEVLIRVTFDWLNELLDGREVGSLDRNVWGRVFYEVIRPLISNLRDVKRYLNSLPVTLDTIGNEIALADLLGLEAIRVLLPKSFEDLRSCADCLVHPESGPVMLMTQDARAEYCRNKLEKFLDDAGSERRVLEALLENLFPVTQGHLGKSNFGSSWTGIWRRARRVACEEVLHIYLHAGLAETELSVSEVNRLVDALTDKVELEQLLDSLDEDSLEDALERLYDFAGEFEQLAVLTAIPAIVNRMWRLSKHPNGALSLPPRWKATWVVDQMLKRIQDPDALTDVVDRVLEDVDSISGRVAVVEIVGHRESVGRRLVSEEYATHLEQRIVGQLRDARIEDLRAEWNLFHISFIVSGWCDDQVKERVYAQLRAHLEDYWFSVALLRTSMSLAFINGHVEKRIPWESLTDIFGDSLIAVVYELSESKLFLSVTDDDREIVELAQKYASGWRPKSFGVVD